MTEFISDAYFLIDSSTPSLSVVWLTSHVLQAPSKRTNTVMSDVTLALKKYSSSVFNQIIYDTALDLSYYPHWINDSLGIVFGNGSQLFP